ncbi:MAG: ABC transporter ATP-binding protein [Aigarchaeota archaeon]|nr:ABC transporter ATP-binding protein [Aigarchaeota archaeon]MCX8193066.1 ABC transporter ATP-binding protein [Nitrososphaeria archaeon]MDW7986915.1 ABC transporter ATP-binding protein [Nitrososphaerota archaeon]
MTRQKILQVENLSIDYVVLDGIIKAVRNVSFTIDEGEVVCLVGESGSGKTTVGLAIAGALPENAVIREGKIIFRGRDFLSNRLKDKSTSEDRIMIIFQDPVATLNPLFRVGEIISDVIKHHLKITNPGEIREKALEFLKAVELPDPERVFNSYPHELSGGMLQRVVIAIALSINPRLLIADEPTTMLDVTLQAQILDLLINLKKKLGVSILFITHNLGVAAEIGDRIIVMYGGEIFEEARSEELLYNPLHPYTRGLLECIPKTHIKYSKLKSIPGMIFDLMNPPKGCTFVDRCTEAMEICRNVKPQLVEFLKDHRVACHLYRLEER